MVNAGKKPSTKPTLKHYFVGVGVGGGGWVGGHSREKAGSGMCGLAGRKNLRKNNIAVLSISLCCQGLSKVAALFTP